MHPEVAEPTGFGEAGFERVDPQIVIPKILVATEEQMEVVPFVLVDVEPRNVVWVAAVTEVTETEVMEEKALMIQRAHIERVIE